MDQSTQTDEILDLVDKNDNVISQKKRSEIYAQSLSNYRVVNAFLVNSEGKLWIPRRTANKRIFPLALDMSVGGHVESGESYDQTLKRETNEELNIDVDTAKVRFLGKLTPQNDGVSAFMHIYEISSDETPSYNKEDIIESFWLTPAELFQKIADGDQAKGDLPALIKKYYH